MTTLRRKRGKKSQINSSVPTGSEAAKMASLNADMLKVGIVKMEEGADPHWLARHFFCRCQQAWEKYKLEHSPNWSVTAIEIASVAVSLMRSSFRPSNGFQYCDLPKVPLPELAVRWIAGAHHTMCIEREMEKQSEEYASLSGLNKFVENASDPNRPMVPVAVILKMAGCDELKPTCDELKQFDHTKETFHALSPTEKHSIRLDILNKCEVALNVAPYSAKTPQRTGGPLKLLPGGFIAEGGLYPISLFTAEHIMALRRAKEQRIRKVRSQAPKTKNTKKCEFSQKRI